MSDFSWHNLCQQRWDSSGFCCPLGHLSEEEIAFQHISLIRIIWCCPMQCKVPCCWDTKMKPAWLYPLMNHLGHFCFRVHFFDLLFHCQRAVNLYFVTSIFQGRPTHCDRTINCAIYITSQRNLWLRAIREQHETLTSPLISTSMTQMPPNSNIMSIKSICMPPLIT